MRRVGLVLFLWLSAATAALAADATTALTPADVAYLTKLGQSQKELAANKPTAEDLEKLHGVINDPATAGKPKVREEVVWKLLDHISAQFLWCSDHPMDKGCGADRAASAK